MRRRSRTADRSAPTDPPFAAAVPRLAPRHGAPREARGTPQRAVVRPAPGILERALDLAREGGAEDRCVEALRVGDAGGRVDSRVVEVGDRAGQIVGAAVPEPPGDAVANRLERAAAAGRDRRPACGLRLDGGDAELLG